jgi:hypothetical protein
MNFRLRFRPKLRTAGRAAATVHGGEAAGGYEGRLEAGQVLVQSLYL